MSGPSEVVIATNTNFHPGTDTSVFDAKLTDAAFAEYRRQWFEYPSSFTVRDFPLNLDIETTGVCNLLCPFCSTTFKQWGPNAPGYMKMDLYRRIIDEGAANGLYAIKLSFRGEPMLHPHLAEMVAYAKAKGILDVTFNTNATLLTAKFSRQLIDARLDRLTISFEGLTKAEYERLRVGAKFEKVVDNVRQLKRVRDEAGVTYPQIRVQRVTVPDNLESFDEYLAFWRPYADEIAEIDCRDEGPGVDHRGLVGNWACNMLWQRMSILWDGTVLPCLMHNVSDFSLMTLGNVKDATVKELWLGQQSQRNRELHQGGEAHQLEACDRCSYRAMELKKLGIVPAGRPPLNLKVIS